MSINTGFMIAQIINIMLLLTPFLFIGGAIWFAKNIFQGTSGEVKQLRKQIAELQRENGRLEGELNSLRPKSQ